MSPTQSWFCLPPCPSLALAPISRVLLCLSGASSPANPWAIRFMFALAQGTEERAAGVCFRRCLCSLKFHRSASSGSLCTVTLPVLNVCAPLPNLLEGDPELPSILSFQMELGSCPTLLLWRGSGRGATLAPWYTGTHLVCGGLAFSPSRP